ncbi:hypothetical protein EK21DRAFT_113229 [Setomelanomma holmii]|uniref:Uncharacterized protein n=1 Tax=Setomelanomma holmii TaxID=210430 RepID=A0A9P4H7X8_9PLEO|nr:hypothetical protein EK21DRAFT_113229 [Setomelanomma holmii]
MSSFFQAPRAALNAQPAFAGAPNASTTSAWVFGSRAPVTPSPLRQAFSSPSFTNVTPSSSDLMELSGDNLDLAVANSSQSFSNIKVIRLHVQLDHIPFALLDTMLEQVKASGSLREVHLCIQSQLWPALQDVQKNVGLERALTSTARKWVNTKILFKFFFFLPHVPAVPEQDNVRKPGTASHNSDYLDFNLYKEVDFPTAIAGTQEASNELYDILAFAEGRSLVRPSVVAGSAGNERGVDDVMGLGEMI